MKPKPLSPNNSIKKGKVKGALKSKPTTKRIPKSKPLETCGVIYSMREMIEKLEKVGELPMPMESGGSVGTSVPDCNICCTVGIDGFKYCYDGNEIRLDNYPTSGGPWMPAIYPNGTWTWVNGG